MTRHVPSGDYHILSAVWTDGRLMALKHRCHTLYKRIKVPGAPRTDRLGCRGRCSEPPLRHPNFRVEYVMATRRCVLCASSMPHKTLCGRIIMDELAHAAGRIARISETLVTGCRMKEAMDLRLRRRLGHTAPQARRGIASFSPFFQTPVFRLPRSPWEPTGVRLHAFLRA